MSPSNTLTFKFVIAVSYLCHVCIGPIKTSEVSWL